MSGCSRLRYHPHRTHCRLNQLRNQLPLIPAFEQHHPRLHHALEPRLYHRLVRRIDLNLPFLRCLDQLRRRLFQLVQKIEHDEALDLDPVADHLEPVLDPVLVAAIVLGHGAASRDPAVPLHAREHEVQHLAAHVVKVDVHVAVGRLDQLVLEARCLVVQARVRAEALYPPALLRSARDPDNAPAAEDVLRDLHDHGPRRARRTRNHHAVALARPRDLRDAVQGRQSRQAQGAEVLRDADALDRLGLLQRAGVEDAVFGPAAAGEDLLPRREAIGGGLEDLADGARPHRHADGDGRGVEPVGVDVGTDPAALGGVVGEVEGLEEDLVRFK